MQKILFTSESVTERNAIKYLTSTDEQSQDIALGVNNSMEIKTGDEEYCSCGIN